MHNVVELTRSNFQSQVIESTLPVLVDFSADWCPPCRMLEPIVDDIAGAYADQLRVGSLDVDAYPELQERYGVMGLPTLILFQKGEPVRHSETEVVAIDATESATNGHPDSICNPA